MKIQVLTCRECETTWERPSQRGKPPAFCPPCRAATIPKSTREQISAAVKATNPEEPKVALTEAELFQIEQDKRRAMEAAAKAKANERIDNLMLSLNLLKDRKREVIIPTTEVSKTIKR